MADIQVPKLNANDNTYILLAWLAADGADITAGTPVAEIETSKAVEEISAPAAGVLRRLVSTGAEITPGQAIALLGTGTPATGHTSGPPAGAEQLITAPARARMTELGISEAQVRALGLKVVRSTDLDGLAAETPQAGPAAHPLSNVQRAVGRAVTRSHATIPAAYTVTKIDVGPALERAKSMIRRVRQPVGLANLVIEVVAALHGQFPAFYAELADDGASIRFADAPHIGVTVDVGAGLYVPVIHNAATRTSADIAAHLTDVRTRAATGGFRASELDGANIGVTLHTEADVVLAIPFIFPGQVCALAVTAPQTEVVLADDGALSNRSVSYIGLAYDHRVINGRDAASYLDALRTALR